MGVGVENVPEHAGQEAGYILEKSPIYHGANAYRQTTSGGKRTETCTQVKLMFPNFTLYTGVTAVEFCLKRFGLLHIVTYC